MGVHIGATWRVRLNRLCAPSMQFMSNYFDHLFNFLALYFHLSPFWLLLSDVKSQPSLTVVSKSVVANFDREKEYETY